MPQKGKIRWAAYRTSGLKGTLPARMEAKICGHLYKTKCMMTKRENETRLLCTTAGTLLPHTETEGNLVML